MTPDVNAWNRVFGPLLAKSPAAPPKIAYSVIGLDQLGNPKCLRVSIAGDAHAAVAWFIARMGGGSVISVIAGYHFDLLDGGSNNASN